MRNYLIGLLLLTLGISAHAQRTIRGKIVDEKGEALIGASILIPGSTRGTVTDLDGRFSLYVPAGTAKIQVSYRGYKTLTVAFPSSGSATIRMSKSGGKFSSSKKLYVSAMGGHSITSDANFDPVGLSSSTGNRYWGGLVLGYNFFKGRKSTISLGLGALYKDYGYQENNSTIPYLCYTGHLKLNRHLFWRLNLVAFGGAEYCKGMDSRYYYEDANASRTDHNQYLHFNDAFTVSYGGGLGLNFGRFGLDFMIEKNIQVDTYDQLYGKTIGGRFSRIALNYSFL
jgi:hypothetical protein